MIYSQNVSLEMKKDIHSALLLSVVTGLLLTIQGVIVYGGGIPYHPGAQPEKYDTIAPVTTEILGEKALQKEHVLTRYGAIIRGDTTKKLLAIVFTGHTFADGGEAIFQTLKKQKIKASFFLTGDFYRNPAFAPIIKKLKRSGHYLGAHSDKHLLYCDWTNRDSLLVTRQVFQHDLLNNYEVMQAFGISKAAARYYLPPYEWYNDSIAKWTRALDLTLINFTPGTLSHADYTTPGMRNYRSSETIFTSIVEHETRSSNGLNGFILLMHIGTDPTRTDKVYDRLDELIVYLKKHAYTLVRIDALLDK